MLNAPRRGSKAGLKGISPLFNRILSFIKRIPIMYSSNITMSYHIKNVLVRLVKYKINYNYYYWARKSSRKLPLFLLLLLFSLMKKKNNTFLGSPLICDFQIRAWVHLMCRLRKVYEIFYIMQGVATHVISEDIEPVVWGGRTFNHLKEAILNFFQRYFEICVQVHLGAYAFKKKSVWSP